ncbi:hypothetical protein SAMN05216257_10124 [Meinhardsimonia xiamenensis]|jgi:hypothetical protein|uniref:Uncharacterized protein n=1 Tax=Meinhardsimonia xiamenensis TaxID=990712 RepID=A0A1G8XSR6_9RHOB|nr:DUF6732 family protein [Meinhardsimonia xiamenensis]PRX37009.1 hypothetical protein LV81_00780 [Meinhardsimonia xiamenensis]SDJ92935.1 hypothetical protein SAMN05216257_10124 [Meinhardsimonia xiamenensis]
MIRFFTLPILLMPVTAAAHPGHIAASGGHDHWIAGAAIALGLGIALWSLLRDRRRGSEQAEADEGESETAEAEAQEG